MNSISSFFSPQLQQCFLGCYAVVFLLVLQFGLGKHQIPAVQAHQQGVFCYPAFSPMTQLCYPCLRQRYRQHPLGYHRSCKAGDVVFLCTARCAEE